MTTDLTTEKVFNKLNLKQFTEYTSKISNNEELSISEIIRKVKELLQVEVSNGYWDKVTGERKEPNSKVGMHTIKFQVYYNNKGKTATSRTLTLMNNIIPNTTVKIIDSDIVDNKCSSYIYEVTTDKENEEIPKLFYKWGASSVYYYNK